MTCDIYNDLNRRRRMGQDMKEEEKKLNTQSLENDLLELAKPLHSDVKPYQLKRYVSKYVRGVLTGLAEGIPRSKDNTEDEISFQLDKVKNQIGRAGNENKKIWDLFAHNPNTALVQVVFVGNTLKMSRVKINSQFAAQIRKGLLDMTTSTTVKETITSINVPVESLSLVQYLKATREYLSKLDMVKQKGLYDAAERSYLAAKGLLNNVKEIDGQEFIVEYYTESDTGRRYSVGSPNLQQSPQQARHAALGRCFKYDFKCCSFSVMVGLAKQFAPSIKVAAIEDYIKNRKNIRKSISKQTGIPESEVKNIFTALGFGAKPINNPYNAIGKQTSKAGKEKFDVLLNNTTFAYVYEDLQEVNKVVSANFEGEFEFLGRIYSLTDKDGKKRKEEQKLSWIYQTAETVIMELFTSVIKEYCGMEPLMTVHDCAYYKKPIPKEAVYDAIEQIREFFPDVGVEREDVYPLTTNEGYNNRFADQDKAEQQHKEFIAQQEYASRGYEGIASSHDDIWVPRQWSSHKHYDINDDGEYEYELENYQ